MIEAVVIDVHRPIARPESSAHVTRRSARLVVVSSEAAMPCTTRAKMSDSSSGAAPTTSDAMAKPIVPMMKPRRRPMRSATAPAAR